jgi:hypothetical protein
MVVSLRSEVVLVGHNVLRQPIHVGSSSGSVVAGPAICWPWWCCCCVATDHAVHRTCSLVVVEMGVAVGTVADPAINSTPVLPPTPVVCSATDCLVRSISLGCC